MDTSIPKLLILSVSSVSLLAFVWYRSKQNTSVVGPIEYLKSFQEQDPKLWESIKMASLRTASEELALRSLINKAITEQDTLENSIVYLLSEKLGNHLISASDWKVVISDILLVAPRPDIGSLEYPDAFHWPPVEGKYSLLKLIRADLVAVMERDPACLDGAHALLYFKGYHCLAAHRVAHVLWKRNQKHLALALQSRCSEVFGMDIHPACIIGKGVMFDHGTGVVIGETAIVGDGCSILHGVTLGGTGKRGNKKRHPTLGDEVLVGANASILGNVKIGNQSRVGCGSVVMTDVPDDSTAVGIPARIAKKYPSDLSGL